MLLSLADDHVLLVQALRVGRSAQVALLPPSRPAMTWQARLAVRTLHRFQEQGIQVAERYGCVVSHWPWVRQLE
jgi:predicted nuclease with RNAse H fold